VAPRRTSGSPRAPFAMLRTPLMELYSHPPLYVHGVTAARRCVNRTVKITTEPQSHGPHIGRNGPRDLVRRTQRAQNLGSLVSGNKKEGPKSPNSLIAQRLGPCASASRAISNAVLLVLLVLCYQSQSHLHSLLHPSVFSVRGSPFRTWPPHE
jgi:hypothetical protein